MVYIEILAGLICLMVCIAYNLFPFESFFFNKNNYITKYESGSSFLKMKMFICMKLTSYSIYSAPNYVTYTIGYQSYLLSPFLYVFLLC